MRAGLNIPRATYRLQLHRGFTLRDALALVPYLDALGASHVYASPLLKACPGSTHGYDVCDPTRLNPELGTEADLEAFVAALRERGMGLVLDIVPNHVGIAGGANPWWQDVLRHGKASAFAKYFDIEWDAAEPESRNKVLVPLLGDEYEQVLQRGELQLELKEDIVTLRYFEHRFPLTPGSLPSLGALSTAGLRDLNENPAALDVLIRRQHYRLVHWRRGDAELNYRRFFSITSLAGVCVEDPSVFDDVHLRVREWIARGLLDGLRVDHPDGLRDPMRYLQRLRQLAPDAWIVVEKILMPGEALPADWPVAGTTGYDFLNQVNGLFVDPAGESPLTKFYAEFTREPTDFPAILLEKKRRMLREMFAAEVSRLTRTLHKIAARQPAFALLTTDLLCEAVIELAAVFPVYRSYFQADPARSADFQSAVTQVSNLPPADEHAATLSNEADVAVIRASLTAARANRPEHSAALGLLDELLSLHRRGELESDFVMRFQQLTGPAMAKGAEDTAFYCYSRFIALNEVGGDPSSFGCSVAHFHRACDEARQHWPDSILATSTHDSKRSEDVRARLALLSEIPERWIAAVRRWSAMNEKYRRNDWPDRNAEYLIYQTLVGAWPLSLDRALACLEKAAREAKQHTSWSDRNAAYETALNDFVIGAMGDHEFLAEIEQFVTPLIRAGHVNSLAQMLLKLTSPGVPDIYQGTDLWDFSLVDPDNRRPVDFELRRRLLSELESCSAEQTWQRRDEGLPKLWLIQKTLALRRRQPGLFDADYQPLAGRGSKAAHLVAFSRGDELVSVAPRLIIGLADDWAETTLPLPRGEWRNALTSEAIGNGACRLADLLRSFPVALVVRKELI